MNKSWNQTFYEVNWIWRWWHGTSLFWSIVGDTTLNLVFISINSNQLALLRRTFFLSSTISFIRKPMENRVHATKHCHWVMFVVLNVINLMAFLIEIKNFLDIVYIVCCVFLFKDLPPLMKDRSSSQLAS